jgi:hypothetical protein
MLVGGLRVAMSLIAVLMGGRRVLLGLVMLSVLVVVCCLVMVMRCGGVSSGRFVVMLGRRMFSLFGHHFSPGWWLSKAIYAHESQRAPASPGAISATRMPASAAC